MSVSNTFVVGQCTRARDSVFLKARAQSVDGSMRDLTHTSQNEFPPDGEIELRGARATLTQDDWAIAKPVLDGPPRRRRWVSQTARKLLPFDDLSCLSNPEAARRLLVETGLQDGFTGEKIFRTGPQEMIVVTMTKSEDGRSRATSPDMARLPLYRFDPAKVLAIPMPGGSISLMEKNHQSPEAGVSNWISDAQYVEQIVRGELAAEDGEQRARAAIAATLLSHADKLASLVSGAGEPDPKIAREILRSRRLGELLASRPALIAEFMSALRRDPDVSARIEQEISRLTMETIETKRSELTADLAASLEAEFASVRRERASKLEAELTDLETSSLQELQAKIDSQTNAALSAIEVRKAGLERAVAELEKTRDTLHSNNRLKTEEIDALNADVGKLTSDVADRKADLDRLLRMEQVLQTAGDRSTKPKRAPSFPLSNPSPTATPLSIGEIPTWLKASSLLTDVGRLGVAKLAALILSGGVPIVAGPEADDVIDVLSSMLAGGALTIFDCDPTVISYDDLWCRPGSPTLTTLGLALADVQNTRSVRLCAVRCAELSPSQFWIETLRRAAKQRTLPKEFLLCVSRGGEAEGEDSNDRSLFCAEGWIEKNAGVQALALVDDDDFWRIADVAALPLDRPAALSAIGTSKARLSIADTRWLAQFVPVAKAVLAVEAGPFVKEVLESVAAGTKPDLRLVDNRGPSRA
ncbi:hypothetical protein GGQ85_000176 [Nitrobacter vulgaris]|uniref:hypothetical protein n=1 Tax=Nitrobacter vulgaris TaxID=29421 RepID=UPI00285850AF|nr:hypothetical protein [Nitrobacter vulgaris]MDR6302505.1 hypothetical protein [Nitrobacter vulgaris]